MSNPTSNNRDSFSFFTAIAIAAIWMCAAAVSIIIVLTIKSPESLSWEDDGATILYITLIIGPLAAACFGTMCVLHYSN